MPIRRPSARTVRPLLVAFAAGLGSATGFAPLSLWLVSILCFALLVSLLRRATRLVPALAIGWAFGFGQFVLGLNWIATAFTYQATMPAWLGWVAVVVLSAYLAVYPALAAGVAWGWRRRGMTTLLLAAMWLVTEWLRGTMFTGFAWNPVGVAWVGTPVAQASMLIGTYGLSALMVLAGGAVAALAGRRWRDGAILIALPSVALLWGLVPRDPGDTARMVHIVQPNIDQDTRNDPDYAYDGLSRLAAQSRPPSPAAPPRLLLWPEAAVEYYLADDPAARSAIAGLLRPGDVLLTGGSALERDRAGTLIGARNSLYAMDAAGRLLARYDKAHLVPYGEYLPMRPVLSAIGLSRLVPGDLDFWPGPGARSIAVPGFGLVGVQICYEIVFSGQVIDPAHRPGFLFNPSNDAWFGAWGPPQHLAQARLRAIEEGVPVIRATPNGISAVIAADGTIRATIPRHVAGTLDVDVPAALPPTPFARAGNLLSFALAALLWAAAIAVRRIRR